jgi:uncharacterized RDD family membrane protein YckC
MDNFQIETAQNVTISQNVASVMDRILAFIIDNLIIGAYLFIVIFILAHTNITGGSEFLYYVTIGLPLFLYHLLWETFWNGQSPGKAVMKIRVVKLDGSRPAFSNYLLRWLLRVVDIALSFGSVAIVTMLFNGKGQRLGDMAATTTVISEKTTTGIQSIRIINLPDDYSPKYPQVMNFKDDEIQTIKSIYYNAKAFGNHHIIIRLSVKVSKVMEVDYDEKPIDFINRVINDYTYYTQQ